MTSDGGGAMGVRALRRVINPCCCASVSRAEVRALTRPPSHHLRGPGPRDTLANSMDLSPVSQLVPIIRLEQETLIGAGAAANPVHRVPGHK